MIMKHLIRIFAITLLVIIASGNNSQLFAQNAGKLFQQGLIKEEGEGMV